MGSVFPPQKAGRFNCPFRTSIRDIHSQLAQLSVTGRMTYVLIKFKRNVIITKTAEIFYNGLTFFSDVHQYSRRPAGGKHFLLLVCRTKKIQRTVQHRAMVAWNFLLQFLISGIHTTTFYKRYRLFIFPREW